MFKYLRFDFDRTKQSNKFKFIILCLIIITLLISLLVININNDIKEDVKIISSNSRRIINDLNNYTETISDFMIPNYQYDNKEELNELKKIKLTLDYFKDIKEQELKEIEIKKQKLKELELIDNELKQKEIKQKELNDLKLKAINLIKSYIPNYDSLFKLTTTHSILNGYYNQENCLKSLIKINNEALFEKLININYDKLEVSFNYLDKNETYYKDTNNILTSHFYENYDENNEYYNYSHYIYKNYRDNIIKNPIYLNVKEKLELDYSYKESEPDLTNEGYNNKSKYFQESLNDFNKIMNKINIEYGNKLEEYYKKDYDNYYNDTKYLYYKYDYYNDGYDIIYKYNNFIEFVINNEIIINNPNSKDIYNTNSYKFKCNIPSFNIKETKIRTEYYRTSSQSESSSIYNQNLVKESIETSLNNDYSYELNNYLVNNNYYFNYYNSYYKIDYNHYDYMFRLEKFNFNYDMRNYIYDINKYSIELEKNKGSRFIKHNLTNLISNYMFEIDKNYKYNYIKFLFQSYYLIEKTYITFPLITIDNEYDYIYKIISGIADIYNLPIIPPIKFI